MTDKKEKSNVDFLRDILKELQADNIGEEARNKKFEEAKEFLDAIATTETGQFVSQEKYDKMVEEKDELEEELEEYKEKGVLDFHTEDVGLDKFYWRLHSGNLKVTQEVESFVTRLKRTYIGVTA